MGVFAELKRRNVVRVGLAYALIAWVLLQAADFFLDVIDAPNWVIQVLLMVALIVGVVVLVFAWIFEMTPEGIKLERDVDRTTSITPHTGRKLDRTIIVFLGLLVAWFLFDEFYLERKTDQGPASQAQQSATVESPAPSGVSDIASVAVLPFVNMSDDKQNEYFSDGLTETLLHMLAQLPDLQVAARTSSFAFKGMNKSVAEIAGVLGVAHILEGSVQKAGDRVRVTAQLVRANDGFHVWSQSYTRPLQDIFAIQDEIATDVAGALGASLLGTGESEVEGVHTTDLTAYESWLKGLEEQAKFSYVSLPAAENHFKQALARDPGFTDARLSLIRNYILEHNTGLKNDSELMAAVGPLLAQVRDEDPGSKLVRALELTVELGMQRTDRGVEDLTKIIDDLRELLVDLPAETIIRIHVSKTLTNFFEEFGQAEEVLQAGLLIDPLSARLHAELGDVYTQAERFEEAKTALIRSLELEPGNPNTYSDMRQLERRLNNLPAALEWARRAIEVDPQDHELAAYLARDMYRLRLPEEGDRWYARVQALAPGSGLALNVAFERAVARGEKDQAIELAQQMISQNPEERQGSYYFTIFPYGSLMSEAGRAREAFEYMSAARPDIRNFDQLANDFQGVLQQWVSVLLMTDFESFETRKEAWSKLATQFDVMGFPWRDPENIGVTVDLVINGDTGGAVDAFLTGPLQRPLARNLLQLKREYKHLMKDVYADPRVAARLGEMDREFEQVRGEVLAMLEQPEWNQ